MKSRMVSILIAIFFCCPIVAVGQGGGNPYPTDCNDWTTEKISCSDQNENSECHGDPITAIDFSNGPGNFSETDATLMCSCAGQSNCAPSGQPPKSGQISCSNVSGYLTPVSNADVCSPPPDPGGGGSGTDPNPCDPLSGDASRRLLCPDCGLRPEDSVPNPPVNDCPPPDLQRVRPSAMSSTQPTASTPEQRQAVQARIDAFIAKQRTERAKRVARQLEDASLDRRTKTPSEQAKVRPEQRE